MLRIIKEYYRVLQSITEYYRVLQSITEYYRVLQIITKYYKVLQRQSYRIYLDQFLWACLLQNEYLCYVLFVNGIVTGTGQDDQCIYI